MAKLILHLPDGSMRDIKLDRDRMSIGRRADNDICLPFPAVSAEHAAIVTVQADSFLHDLGSTNGTLVNGSRIAKHFLRDHDKLDVGRQHLVYLTDEAETIDPLPPDQRSQELRSLSERVPSVYLEAEEATQEMEDAHERRGKTAAHGRAAPVDDLLADLLEMETSSSAAVEMSPSVSIVSGAAPRRSEQPSRNGSVSTSGEARIKVLSGPNAGQTTTMTRPEFVFGKRGHQIAAIRRTANDYRLVPLDRSSRPSINGLTVEGDGAQLTFGDTIEVGGVKVRFERHV